MDDNLEVWRHFQREHLNLQTAALLDQQRMLRSIRTYVAWFFWLTIIGSVVLAMAINDAEPVPIYYP